MSLNFPTNPTLNQTYALGSRTYKWNGNTWDRTTSSAITILYATITVSWSGASFDSSGKFTGTLLKGDYATITIVWNAAPINFTQSKVLTPYENVVRNSSSISNFTVSQDGLTYTFNYKPTSVPAQIKISAADNISTADNIRLNYDIYSLALGVETRPYVSIDLISNPFSATYTYTGTDSTIYNVLDTEISPAVTRYYIRASSTSANALTSERMIKYNFINFKDVPTSYTEAGYTSDSATNNQYYFGYSLTVSYNDIGKSITYSHTTLPGTTTAITTQYSGTNTTYGFYATSGGTLYSVGANNAISGGATRQDSSRGFRFTPGAKSYLYSGVIKIQVLANNYADNKTLNVDGIAYYLGMFGTNATYIYELSTDKDNITYGNVKYIKARFNTFRALTNTNRTPQFTTAKSTGGTGGTLGTPIADPTDPYGLTYKIPYTPIPDQDYTETITGDNSWKVVNLSGIVQTSISCLAPITFTVKQLPVKFVTSTINSSNTNNYPYANILLNTNSELVVPTVSDIYGNITSIKYGSIVDVTPGANTYGAVIDNFSNSNINAATIKTPLATGISSISINLTPSSYIRGNTYAITIPTDFAYDMYGNRLENINNSTILYQFKPDSLPITLTGAPNIMATKKPTIANKTPYLSIVPNKPLASIANSATFMGIYEANSTGNIIGPASSTGPLTWIYNNTYLSYSTTLSTINDTVGNLFINDSSKIATTYNKLRELRVGKYYVLKVDLSLCKDKFNNTGTAYLEPFIIDPVDFNVISTNNNLFGDSSISNYSSSSFPLTFERGVFLKTSTISPELTNLDDNIVYNNTNNFTITGYNTGYSDTNNSVNITTNIDLKAATNYKLKIPAGIFEDYLGNPNKEAVQYFTTATLNSVSADIIIEGNQTNHKPTSTTRTWKVPFSVNTVCLVLIGQGSTYNGGAMAWINNLTVTPNATYTIITDSVSTRFIDPSGTVLITAQAGSTTYPTTYPSDVTRAGFSFHTSLSSNSSKGGALGGLGIYYVNNRIIYDTNVVLVNGNYGNYPTMYPAGAGNYDTTGTDANTTSSYTTPSLYGKNSFLGGPSGNYNLYGTSTYSIDTNDSGGGLSNYVSVVGTGAARIIWGPNRSFPNNAT